MDLVILLRPLGQTTEFRLSMFDFISKHSAIWLSVYMCGSVLLLSVIAGTFGGGAAGTMAGFLVMAGTVGYEMLSRYETEKKIADKVSTLGLNHDRLTREMARTRGELDGLKDDMARAANLLKKQQAKFEEPTIGETITNKIQKTFEKMGTKPRASVSETAKKYEDLLLVAASRADALFVEDEDGISNITAARPGDYSDTVVTELIHHAVHNDRIEIFAQPIVRLPSRRLVYLELFARIRARAGVYLAADRYRELAEKQTLITDVDHLLLIHVLDSIRADARRNVEIGYFINISADTLKDPAFMGDLLEFIKRNRELSQYLIFELQQAEFNKLTDQVVAVIRALGQTGCRFSIDNIDNPNLDVTKLQKMKIEFIKLDAGKLISLTMTAEGETMINRLKTRLDSANITLILEKIETEKDMRELLDFEIDYGEGYLFGKPDLEIAYRPKKAA